MYYQYRQDSNSKEPMLGTASTNILEAASSSRPYQSSFAPGPVQGNSTTAFHQGGSIPSMHNVQGNYNLQNMQNALSARSGGVGVAANAAPQTAANLQSGRFGPGGLTGGLPQIPNVGVHGSLAPRSSLNTGGTHPLGSHMNGIGAGMGGGGGNLGSVRGSVGGAALGTSQVGSSRLNPQGVGGLGPGQSLVGGGPGGGGRNLSGLASLPANGLRSSVPMGPPIGSMAVQALLRSGAPLQQGMGVNQAAYAQGGEFSHLTSRGQPAGPLPNNANTFSSASGSAALGQLQTAAANGQMASFAMGGVDGNLGEAAAFDINEFPSLNSRPSSSGSAPGSTAHLRKTMQQSNSEFSIQSKEFPALPGNKVGGVVDSQGHLGHPSQLVGGLGGGHYDQMGSHQHFQQQQQQQQSAPATPPPPQHQQSQAQQPQSLPQPQVPKSRVPAGPVSKEGGGGGGASPRRTRLASWVCSASSV